MYIEYKMTKEMAKGLLADRKGADKKMSDQKFLCKYVNEILGMKGTCTRVLVSL